MPSSPLQTSLSRYASSPQPPSCKKESYSAFMRQISLQHSPAKCSRSSKMRPLGGLESTAESACGKCAREGGEGGQSGTCRRRGMSWPPHRWQALLRGGPYPSGRSRGPVPAWITGSQPLQNRRAALMRMAKGPGHFPGGGFGGCEPHSVGRGLPAASVWGGDREPHQVMDAVRDELVAASGREQLCDTCKTGSVKACFDEDRHEPESLLPSSLVAQMKPRKLSLSSPRSP